jgi:hypothetical protein
LGGKGLTHGSFIFVQMSLKEFVMEFAVNWLDKIHGPKTEKNVEHVYNRLIGQLYLIRYELDIIPRRNVSMLQETSEWLEEHPN